MVDAATGARTEHALPAEKPATEPATAWAMVHGRGNAGLDSYEALCSNAIVAPPQSARWIRAWVGETNPDYLIASLRLDGATLYALPLEIVVEGGLKVARYMGGSHANGNFAPASPAWLASADTADLRALTSAIRKARPDIDILRLERQAIDLHGFRNPLLLLPHVRSPNIALAADLSGGFDALLERASGKRKRKKNRSQQRKFAEAGGFEMVRASTPEEVEDLLTAFFLLKHRRFESQGIEDVFADPATRNFLTRLFTEALGDENVPFRLDALRVGGIIRAVAGTSVSGNTLTCDFVTIREDELSQASPGEFLFFETIRRACEEGFEVFDFSVGDERYKREWCDRERTQFDTLYPLTRRGRIAALRMSAIGKAKGFVKNNSVLWPLVVRLRRGLAGARTPASRDPV